MAGKRQVEDRAWFERELEGSEFRDARLSKRFGTLLEQLWKGMGQTSLPARTGPIPRQPIVS
ncbi:transposase DNA-binding-containing protein [Paraburkholderia humisilvae]|uniref:transposase DNA-binding-containing protein n=1 Tax=Paraburkholderia humisilvae TaxID=627669 RepID=UPI0035EF812B